MKSVKYLLAFAVLLALFAVINNQETSSFIEKKGTVVTEFNNLRNGSFEKKTLFDF